MTSLILLTGEASLTRGSRAFLVLLVFGEFNLLSSLSCNLWSRKIKNIEPIIIEVLNLFSKIVKNSFCIVNNTTLLALEEFFWGAFGFP